MPTNSRSLLAMLVVCVAWTLGVLRAGVGQESRPFEGNWEGDGLVFSCMKNADGAYKGRIHFYYDDLADDDSNKTATSAKHLFSATLGEGKLRGILGGSRTTTFEVTQEGPILTVQFTGSVSFKIDAKSYKLRRQETIEYSDEVLDSSLRMLPRQYSGQDIVQIYNDWLKVGPRSEFETTLEYGKKVLAGSSLKGTRTASSCFAVVVDLNPAIDIKYDADQGTMVVSVPQHYAGKRLLAHRVRGVLDEDGITYHDLLFLPQSELDSFRPSPISFAVAPALAQAIKPRLQTLVLFRIKDSVRTKHRIDFFRNADLMSTWVFDPANGIIYARRPGKPAPQ